MLILFLALWALFFGAIIFAIAVTPTTLVTPARDLIKPCIASGVFAALVTFCVAGFLSIFF